MKVNNISLRPIPSPADLTDRQKARDDDPPADNEKRSALKNFSQRRKPKLPPSPALLRVQDPRDDGWVQRRGVQTPRGGGGDALLE